MVSKRIYQYVHILNSENILYAFKASTIFLLAVFHRRFDESMNDFPYYYFAAAGLLTLLFFSNTIWYITNYFNSPKEKQAGCLFRSYASNHVKLGTSVDCPFIGKIGIIFTFAIGMNFAGIFTEDVGWLGLTIATQVLAILLYLLSSALFGTYAMICVNVYMKSPVVFTWKILKSLVLAFLSLYLIGVNIYLIAFWIEKE